MSYWVTRRGASQNLVSSFRMGVGVTNAVFLLCRPRSSPGETGWNETTPRLTSSYPLGEAEEHSKHELPSMARSSRRQHGFTLIEMVLSITVMSIVALVGAQLLANGSASYSAATDSIDTFAKLRYAMTRMAAEIREADYNGTQYQITMAANQLVFTKQDLTTVTIATSGSNVTLGYSSPAVTATLTDQLSSLAFAYYQSNAQTAATSAANVAYVDVSLTLSEGGTLYSRRQRIALRDKP